MNIECQTMNLVWTLVISAVYLTGAVLSQLPGGQGVQTPENVNWLDAAPGVAMEYKVHVDAAKEDCYWQYVHPGATFYVSAQVLKGGDGSIGIGIRRLVRLFIFTILHSYHIGLIWGHQHAGFQYFNCNRKYLGPGQCLIVIFPI